MNPNLGSILESQKLDLNDEKENFCQNSYGSMTENSVNYKWTIWKCATITALFTAQNHYLAGSQDPSTVKPVLFIKPCLM